MLFETSRLRITMPKERSSKSPTSKLYAKSLSDFFYNSVRDRKHKTSKSGDFEELTPYLHPVSSQRSSTYHDCVKELFVLKSFPCIDE